MLDFNLGSGEVNVICSVSQGNKIRHHAIYDPSVYVRPHAYKRKNGTQKLMAIISGNDHS